MTCHYSNLLIYPLYFTEKSQSKLPSHVFKKEDEGLGCLSYNFAKVTTKLGNLNWKGWPQQQFCSSYLNIGQSVLETLSINRKMLMKYLRLKFFLAVI